MPSGSGVRAGGAFVELFTKDGALAAGLKKAQAMLKTFAKTSALVGGGIAGIGTGTLGGLAALAKFAAGYGDQLSKASDRTGIAVESLSALKYAAEQSDASLDDVVGGVLKMQKAIGAAQGAKGATPFSQLGLDADALAQMKPEDALSTIADALSKIDSPTERNAAAFGVFGKSVGVLLPLLKDGAGGIGQLNAEFRRLNLPITDSDARAMTKFGDEMATVWAEIKRMAFSVGAAIGIAVTPYVTMLKNAIGPIVAFVDQNRNLAITVAFAASAISAAGFALIGIAGVATVASIALGAIATVWAFIASPITLTAAAIGVVGFVLAQTAADFLLFSQQGQQMVAVLLASISPLLSTFTKTFAGIADAIKGGELQLAGQIALAGLSLAFAQGKLEIISIWDDMLKALATGAFDAFQQIENGLADLLLFAANHDPLLTSQQQGDLILGSAGIRMQAGIDHDNAIGLVGKWSDAKHEADTAPLAMRIAELEKELAGLRHQASDAAALHISQPDPTNVKAKVTAENYAGMFDAAQLKTSSIGGFSAEQIGRTSSATGVWDKIAADARRTANSNDKIAENTANSGEETYD